jgi:GNAT superfamily N-acetyltransferase
MAGMLPRLFFEHFTDTSFAAERDGRLVGFLAGFISQSRPGEAYIHFVGVDPAQRGRGLGRLLYEARCVGYRSRSGIGSASAARHAGAWKRSAKYWVSCVTRSPVNSMTLTA